MIFEVSDTAFLVAYHRALESDSPDPLVRDPYARVLAGERGRRIVEGLPIGSTRGWPLAVRTRVYDEMIVSAALSGEVDAVLNLGAGLDARPYRLALPAAFAWVEADLPPVIRYKSEVLASATPACSLERCPIDLADVPARQALFEHVARKYERVFVLTEGFLGYFDEDAVGTIATSLHSLSSMRLWATEVLSPALLPYQGHLAGGALHAAKIELKFAPAQGVGFFAQRGWRPRRILPFFDEAGRLGRGPTLTPEQSSAVRDSSEYVLLESAPRASGLWQPPG